MASFPNSVKSYTTKTTGQAIDASHINDLQAEVTAIEDGYLNGTARLNSSNSTLANLSVTGGSTFGAVTLGASTLASLSVTGNSTLAALQAGASTHTSLSVSGGSTLANLTVSGNSTVGSSITIGALPYIFPSAGGSTGTVLTVDSTSGSTMTLKWGTAVASPLTLIAAGSGTVVGPSGGAGNAATQAISGLTVKDKLVVTYRLGATGLDVASINLYSTTDSLALVELTLLGNIVAANPVVGTATLGVRQTANTKFMGTAQGFAAGGATMDSGNAATLTTAWTGSWTLALRYANVQASATFDYAWEIYKLAGQ